MTDRLRACLKFPSGLEHAFEAHAGHEHRGEQGHGSRGVEARLVVDAQAPVALQAAEGLLNLPVAGLGPEPLAARGADVSGRPRGGGRRSALPHPKKEGH